MMAMGFEECPMAQATVFVVDTYCRMYGVCISYSSVKRKVNKVIFQVEEAHMDVYRDTHTLLIAST